MSLHSLRSGAVEILQGVFWLIGKSKHAARAIELLSDNALHERMATAARKTAVERFSTALIIPKYEEYYRKVVGGGL